MPMKWDGEEKKESSGLVEDKRSKSLPKVGKLLRSYLAIQATFASYDCIFS